MEKSKAKLFRLSVLVALGVIFVPVLLNNTSEAKSPDLNNLPAAPTLKTELPEENVTPATVAAPQENTPPAGASLYSKTKEELIKEREAINKREAENDRIAQEKSNAPLPDDEDHHVARKDRKTRSEYESKYESKYKTRPYSTSDRNYSRGADRGGWAIQIGTYGVPEHARHMVTMLRRSGYPAYTQRTMRGNRVFTTVLVGPEIRREDIVKMKMDLDSQLRVNGMIVRFAPMMREQRK